MLFAPRLGRPRRASPLSAADLQEAAPKLLNRYFVLFVAGAGIINASHGFLFGFVSIYWKSIGLERHADRLALGLVPSVSEVGMFVVFTRVLGTRSRDRAAWRWRAWPRSCAGSSIR